MRDFVSFLVGCVIAIVLIWLLVPATGCGYLSNERYVLLGCNPDSQVCKVFDSYTGEVQLRPLPIAPAERGQQEVKK